ncbi:hypothetical protein FOZ60_005455 [Perkinsus olseni]|uniref:Uncharacterized protein n=1 Tax=Perkinsus olseni TaxID=32597 RepID=A0A7J6NRV5_PEROL|nr:hypothetical protein FOZ60_005455 [Perkinsus olseni]
MPDEGACVPLPEGFHFTSSGSYTSTQPAMAVFNSILWQVVVLGVAYPSMAVVCNSARPEWYYCAENDWTLLNKLFFSPNGNGNCGSMRAFLYDLAGRQMTFYSPYRMDDAGFVSFGDGRPGKSINDTHTFPYMHADYTLQYNTEANSITMSNSTGQIFRYTPQACQWGSRLGVPKASLAETKGRLSPAVPLPAEGLKNTPCWHWVTIWAAFDVTSESVNITGPYTSFHFTFVRLNDSMLKVEPHHSEESATLLYGYKALPYTCPPP